MATQYGLMAFQGKVGPYWATLTTEQKLRYGSSGNELVASGMADLVSKVNAMSTDYTRELIIEIADAWTDTTINYSSISNRHYSITLTSSVNGARSSAYHYGNVNAGYYANYGAVITNSEQKLTTVDGVRAKNTRTDGVVFQLMGSRPIIKNNIVLGGGYGTLLVDGSLVYNNIFYGLTNTGLAIFNKYGADSGVYANNLCTGCGKGVDGQYSGATVVNNISIGNSTNWGTIPNYTNWWSHNVGEVGDTVWGTDVILADTSIFIDFANQNYRPANSLSPQVNSGIVYPLMDMIDIAGVIRPNYEPSTYPNNLVDRGPFEYDFGNGLAPLQVPLAFSGMAEGSVLAVYKTSDGSAIISPTTISAPGSYSTTYSYTGDTQITVVVRKGTSGTKYLPYTAPGLITSSGFALIVNQVVDGVLNG